MSPTHLPNSTKIHLLLLLEKLGQIYISFSGRVVIRQTFGRLGGETLHAPHRHFESCITLKRGTLEIKEIKK